MRLGLVACVVLLPLVAHGQVIGDDVRAEAKAHYDRGKKNFANQDFLAAAVEFGLAEKLFANIETGPDGQIVDADAHGQRRKALSNEATSYSQAKMPVEARDTFVLYKHVFESELPPDEVQATQSAIDKLEETIGSVRILGMPTDADARLDGQRAPASKDALPFAIAAGEHHLEVRARAFKPFTTAFTVAGKQTVTVDVQMQEADDPARIRIEVGVENASVEVDGAPKGHAPVEIVVKPGKHTYSVRAESYRDQTGEVTAVSDERAIVTVGLIPRRTPLGIRIEPHVGAAIPLRGDTPFNGGITDGLRLFAGYFRMWNLRAGVEFEQAHRDLDQFGIGGIAEWCPDRFRIQRTGDSSIGWCPAAGKIGAQFGGRVVQFRGGGFGGLASTSLLFESGTYFGRLSTGLGFDTYYRNTDPLAIGVWETDVSFGIDL